MPFNVGNTSRKVNSLTTPILRQQRSSCVAVFHRYDKEDLSKLVNLNITNESALSAGFLGSSDKNISIKQPLIVRQDITKCSVTNNKAGGGGNFTLTLKRGKMVKGGITTLDNIDYLQSIQNGDWIMIYMKKSGEITDKDIATTTPESGFKFLGIVENVRELELDDPTKATPRLEILVTGKSYAKVFDTDIFFNPILNQETINTVLGASFLTDSSRTVSAVGNNTADSVVKKLINFYLGKKSIVKGVTNQNWYVPMTVARAFKGPDRNKNLGKAFIDLLNLSKVGLQKYNKGVLSTVSSLPGAALIKALPSSGTVWSVMDFMKNAAVNEMYTELTLINGKLQPSLILRQLPFSNKPNHETNIFFSHNKANRQKVADPVSSGQKTFFVDLPKLRIISSDIKQKNIGKSDHERINYVIVVPKIDSNTYDKLYMVGANPVSTQRHGLKIFNAQTSYVLSGSNVDQNGIKNFCARAVSLIQDWFFLSHMLYNGTIITDGIDGFVEVGSNLYIQDIKQLFHIEGYTHTYQVESESRIVYDTEFRVSRGQYFDESRNIAAFIGSNNVVKETTTVVTSLMTRSKEG